MQHVRLRTADAHGHECGDVAVAAVLAEKVGPVPEPRHRFRGQGQRPHRGVEGPSLRPGAGPRLGDEVGSTGDTGGVGEVAEDPPQCGDRATFACCVGSLGGDRVPYTGDVTGDLAVGEVVEQRVDHRSRNLAAQRRSPSSEIGVPHVAEAERHDRFGRFVGHVGDDRDGLDQLKEAAGHGLRHRPTVPLSATAILRLARSADPCRCASARHAGVTAAGITPNQSGNDEDNLGDLAGCVRVRIARRQGRLQCVLLL